MARPRQYASDAERQRAFRQRQQAQIARVDRGALDRLHARLDQLQTALRAAAAAGDTTARTCQAAGIDTMLERLAHHFNECADRSRSTGEPAVSRGRPEARKEGTR
jgi:hypothetical protein